MEDKKNSVEIGSAPQSSAEVSQNAKGDLAYKVKLYFNSPEGVATAAKKLYDELKSEFEGQPREE